MIDQKVNLIKISKKNNLCYLSNKKRYITDGRITKVRQGSKLSSDLKTLLLRFILKHEICNESNDFLHEAASMFKIIYQIFSNGQSMKDFTVNSIYKKWMLILLSILASTLTFPVLKILELKLKLLKRYLHTK